MFDQAQLDAVATKLEVVARLSGGSVPAPAEMEAVDRWEAHHGVKLPADYRAFVTQVCNGGPGPDYGLAPLEHSEMPREGFVVVTSTITYNDGSGSKEISAGTGPRPKSSRGPEPRFPFALESDWRPVDEAGQSMPSPVPDGVHPYDGTLHLVDKGCGYFDFLVVSGPRAGEVWTDYTAGDGAVYTDGLSFLQWYGRWVDRALIGWIADGLDGRDEELLSTTKEVLPEWISLLEAELERADEATRRWLSITAVFAHLELGNEDRARAIMQRVAGEPRGEHRLEPVYRRIHADAFERSGADSVGEVMDLVEHEVTAVRRTLAANPSAPVGALQALASDRSTEVVRAVAANPTSTPEALLELVEHALQRWAAGEDTASALELAARHPNTPPPVLRELALPPAARIRELDSQVLRGVAFNEATPTEVLETLADHDAPWVRQAVAYNHSTPLPVLERLIEDADLRVAGAVGYHPRATVAMLRSLADGPGEAGRRAAATNPNTPVEVLLALLADAVYGPKWHHSLDYSLRRNPSRHPQIVELLKLLDDYDFPEPDAKPSGWGNLPYDATGAAALQAGKSGHPGFPVAKLDEAMEWNTRMATYDAGANPWLTPAQLERLATDAYAYTRLRVVRHPNSPSELVLSLADDESGIVRGPALAHPDCPQALIEKAAEHPEHEGRVGAAGSSRLSREKLARLLEDPEWTVRASAGRNPQLEPDDLKRLAADENAHVRKTVALHPKVTPELLATLAEDEAEVVQSMATYRQRLDAALATVG